MSKLDLIKSIRNRTNLSYKDIQKAVDALNTTDEEQIIQYLRQQGVLKAQARQDRETNHGGIFSYVHSGRLGVLLEIKCETDFVGRNEDFQNLGQDLTLHIAAYLPKFVSENDVDEDFVAKELEIAKEQLTKEGKPQEMMEKILNGKKEKIVKEYSLLSQPFLKNPEITVAEKLAQVSQSTGEKILITRFTVFSLNN